MKTKRQIFRRNHKCRTTHINIAEVLSEKCIWKVAFLPLKGEKDKKSSSQADNSSSSAYSQG